MKAIQELVAHFDRQKKLTPRQINQLLEQGFLATEAPPRLVELCADVGATYYFRVTGTSEGTVWGTDTYTGDSTLAAAAVHAGVLALEETGVVKVTVVAPLGQYQGSTRQGVTTYDFGRFGTAYKVDKAAG